MSGGEGAGAGSPSRAHAAPFYCPYCGEEDLVPLEGHGQWACGSCRRAFRLSLTAIAAGDTAPPPNSSGATSAPAGAASTTGGEQ